MDSRFETLSGLFKDAGTAQKLISLTAEEAVNFLRDHYHLDFTVDELNDVAAGARKAMEDASSDELSEDALEAVAGGGSGAYNAGYYIGKGLQVVGVVVGIGAVAFGW